MATSLPSLDQPIRLPTQAHLYAGFVSGLTSSVLLQPLDLLKTRVQQSSQATLVSSYKSVPGVSGLWKGVVPSALRTSIGTALYLTTLSQTRAFIARTPSLQQFTLAPSSRSSLLPQLTFEANLVCGTLGRGLVGLVTMPLTVIKARTESVQLHRKPARAVLRDIYKDGGARAFFKGTYPTFWRDAPHAGLAVLLYEHAKSLLNYTCVLSAASVNATAAGSSALVASILTSPFDVVKTRIQIAPATYPNFLRTCTMIMSEQGWRGFFKGLGLRITRKAASSAISWALYEEIVKLLWRPAP